MGKSINAQQAESPDGQNCYWAAGGTGVLKTGKICFPRTVKDNDGSTFDTCLYPESNPGGGISCNLGACSGSDCSFGTRCQYFDDIPALNQSLNQEWGCPVGCFYSDKVSDDNSNNPSACSNRNLPYVKNAGTCLTSNCQSGQDYPAGSSSCGYIYGISTGTAVCGASTSDVQQTQPPIDGGTVPSPTPRCSNPQPNSPHPDEERAGSDGCWCKEIGGDEKCFNTYNELFSALSGANQCQGRVQGNVTVTGVDEASGNVVAFKKGFRYKGATVNLLKGGKVIDTTKTNDTKGIYQFTGLSSGEHKVELEVPSGYKLVSKAGAVEKSTQNPKDFNIDSCDDEDHQGWIIEKTGSGDDDGDNPPPSDKTTVKIELAEDPNITSNVITLTSFDLDSAGNVLTDYTFSDPTPGIKNLCARFTPNEGTPEVKCKQIEIVADTPEITDISCTRSGGSVIFDIGGNFFGTTTGKVESDTNTLGLRGAWTQTQVRAILNNAGSAETYPIKLTRFDGLSDETTCSPAGEIQLSVGANYFCPAVPNHAENNVNFVIFDGDNPAGSGGKLASETVKINGSGVIEGLNFVFEEGRNYIVSVKSPRSLARFGKFTAGSQTGGQTNIIDIGLPIGDIAPSPSGDGVINSLDKSLLNKQWSLTQDVEKTGDFNDDQRVNSVDWACMRNDFNATDETLEGFSSQSSDEDTTDEDEE